MRRTIWEKRIPTLLGVLLIAISVGVTSFLANRALPLVSRASYLETPQHVRISNISDTSFTVSYTTQESVPGIVSYGKDINLGQTTYDDKQQLGEIKSYKTHYITIRNLSPSTKYYFSIISGKNTFLNDTVPFEVSTAPTIASSPSQEQPISGKVILPNGETPTEGVTYVTIPGTQTISTMVKSDGSYIIPLNSIRSENLSSAAKVSKDSVLHMLFVEGELESTVTVSKKLANPVGIVTLSHTYDFTTSVPDTLENTSASAKTTGGFPSFSAKETAGIDPKIITPKKDEGFSDQQPLFRGTATPGQTVTITIHSTENIQTQVKADNSGTWIYRPSTALSPGIHTISIISKGSSGILKTITASFTVYAQGSQVTQAATPSATPTLVTPTIPATPTPTLVTSTPTPTVIVIPSPTPLPPVTSKGGQELPSPGNSLVPVGLMALGTTFVGVVLFLLTRGGSPL